MPYDCWLYFIEYTVIKQPIFNQTALLFFWRRDGLVPFRTFGTRGDYQGLSVRKTPVYLDYKNYSIFWISSETINDWGCTLGIVSNCKQTPFRQLCWEWNFTWGLNCLEWRGLSLYVYFWRSRDELISDVLLWTPTHGRAKAGRPARTYIQQVCEDTGCSPEDLPEAMNDREKWRERVRDIRATSTTWWWWWWFLICLLYVLRTSRDLIEENSLIKKEKK